MFGRLSQSQSSTAAAPASQNVFSQRSARTLGASQQSQSAQTCPACGSDDLDVNAYDDEDDESQAQAGVTCRSCGHVVRGETLRKANLDEDDWNNIGVSSQAGGFKRSRNLVKAPGEAATEQVKKNLARSLYVSRRGRLEASVAKTTAWLSEQLGLACDEPRLKKAMDDFIVTFDKAARVNDKRRRIANSTLSYASDEAVALALCYGALLRPASLAPWEAIKCAAWNASGTRPEQRGWIDWLTVDKLNQLEHALYPEAVLTRPWDWEALSLRFACAAQTLLLPGVPLEALHRAVYAATFSVDRSGWEEEVDPVPRVLAGIAVGILTLRSGVEETAALIAGAALSLSERTMPPAQHASLLTSSSTPSKSSEDACSRFITYIRSEAMSARRAPCRAPETQDWSLDPSADRARRRLAAGSRAPPRLWDVGAPAPAGPPTCRGWCLRDRLARTSASEDFLLAGLMAPSDRAQRVWQNLPSEAQNQLVGLVWAVAVGKTGLAYGLRTGKNQHERDLKRRVELLCEELATRCQDSTEAFLESTNRAARVRNECTRIHLCKLQQ